MHVRKWAFVTAAPQSGSGKTIATLAILAALRRRGFQVQAFKIGPDFIDPGLHSRVTGRVSRNLDGWMLSRETNRALFRRFLRTADGAVVEGVMGLFDGYDGRTESGSTAEMAKWLGLPVILVVDARSMARSVAALVHGFCTFDPELACAGVIFNRVGSPAHLDFLREAMSVSHPHLPVLGGLPRDELLRLPERHLGLVTAEESQLDEAFLDRLARTAEDHLSLDRLLTLTTWEPEEAQEASSVPQPLFSASRDHSGTPSQMKVWGNLSTCGKPPLPAWGIGQEGVPAMEVRPGPGSEQRHVAPDMLSAGGAHGELDQGPLIAIARDAVFCFYYQDNLDFLEAFGARLRFFSPLAGETIPEDAAALYLGGGYPEVHAKDLVQNKRFFNDLRAFAVKGRPIYAECGGLMVLSRYIELLSGERVPMAGILPFGTRMLPRRKALGYVEVELTRSCVLGEPGMQLRGHEFHYSEIVEPVMPSVVSYCYRLKARKYRLDQNEGYQMGSVLASYVHLHWGSAPHAAASFTAAAGKVSRS